jgi:hypothetical protein
MEPGHTSPRRKWSRVRPIIFGVLIGAVVVAAGFFVWSQFIKEDADAAAKTKSKEIVAQVGEIFMLPTDEEPTVAKIQDLSKLKGQEFFVAAKDGDYVLIYANEKVAFLYRESEGKLVNVGPIRTDDPQPADQTSTDQ